MIWLRRASFLWVLPRSFANTPKYFVVGLVSHSYVRQQVQRLNSAVFSGGSFIYVPPTNVKVKQPLQAYFRINAENFGQFERTLIIADEGSEVTYMEGCTAPKFETSTLHSAVVELVALKEPKSNTSQFKTGPITYSTSSRSVHVQRKRLSGSTAISARGSL